jgi:hypothetical protein
MLKLVNLTLLRSLMPNKNRPEPFGQDGYLRPPEQNCPQESGFGRGRC